MYGQELLQAVERILKPEEAAAEAEALPMLRHVVLAEDDAGIAANVRHSFELKGYEVEVLASGPEVLDRVADLHPDVIVMKEVLSGMNGSLVAAGLKSTGRLREVPIIVYDEPPAVGEFHRFELKPPEGVDAFVATSEAVLLLRAVDKLLRK
jgi:CheY-like chemotaxis protein